MLNYMLETYLLLRRVRFQSVHRDRKQLSWALLGDSVLELCPDDSKTGLLERATEALGIFPCQGRETWLGKVRDPCRSTL